MHQRQLSNVYLALSQSAMGSISRGFPGAAIQANEHMAMTFTLSKDAETGTVTITYSEPKGFKPKFNWTTTVQLDGTSSVTAMVFSPATGE